MELSEALSTEVARLRREVDRRRDGSTLLLLWQCFSMVDHLFNIVSIISRDKTTRPFASGYLDELMEQLISPSACAANGRLGGSARPPVRATPTPFPVTSLDAGLRSHAAAGFRPPPPETRGRRKRARRCSRARPSGVGLGREGGTDETTTGWRWITSNGEREGLPSFVRR